MSTAVDTTQHHVEIKPATDRMIIVAGQIVEQEITIVNMTALPDNFDLVLEGLPQGWYSFSSPSVNLFPNWSESVKLRIEVSDKVRPRQYFGRITVTSRTQPGIRAEIRVGVEVLAPLKLDARLQPHIGRGFKARYNLQLRNRSMCDVQLSMGLFHEDEYRLPTIAVTLANDQVRIPAGRTEIVKLKMQLAPKVPREEAYHLQRFSLYIKPKWFVGQATIDTEDQLVNGDYQFESRYILIQRHPWVVGSILAGILAIILWTVLILPAIQNGLLLITENINLQSTARRYLKVEKSSFSRTIQETYNPVRWLVEPEIEFLEAPQTVEVKIKGSLFPFPPVSIAGHIVVDPIVGNVTFVAEDPEELKTFPWIFCPPDKVMQKINIKVRRWLANQNPRQQIVLAEIEGNTLFLRLKECTASEPNCGRAPGQEAPK